MKNNIENIRNCGLTADILYIIKNHKSHYFNARGIRFELFKNHGYSLRGRPNAGNNTYNDPHLKRIASTKIGHVVRKLKARGFLEKISNSTWKLIKPIELNMVELYTKEERALMGEQVG